MSQQMTIPQALDLATKQYQSGQFAAAESICSQVLSVQPENPDALHLLGVVTAQAGKIDAAIELVNRAISIQPAPGYFNSLGQIYARISRWDSAIKAYERAIQLAPDLADAHYNLAMAQQEDFRWDAAIDSNHRLLKLKPDFAPAYNNLGLAYHAQGRLDEAVEVFERALVLSPDKALIHYNFAMSLLLKGELERGFAEYEWRCREPMLRMCREYPQPLWDGSDLRGRRILVHSEQGLGDTIQFARYLPWLHERCGDVLLQCQPPLMKLMQRINGIDEVISRPKAAGETGFDVHCPLLSLPALFKTTPGTIPAKVPYFHVDPDRSDAWKKRLSSIDKVKVGLVWAGRMEYGNDRFRSISLNQLGPLAEAQNVQFVSLQKGAASQQTQHPPNEMKLIDWTAELDDFVDTAALIDNLDLVIAVDTAVAHLAGALAKPTWLLLPFVPDWRWMMDREDSPWYPTMKLFRQQRIGDWSGPIARILAELKAKQQASA